VNRVYKYGLLSPTLGFDLIDDTIYKSHRYYNTLIEIERGRRTHIREALCTHADTESLVIEITNLAAERDEAREQIKRKRSASRSRSESAEQRERVRQLGIRLRALRAQLKDAKAVIATDPMIAGAIKLANEHAAQRRRDERKRCGVYWGTYLLIEAAVDQAAKSKMDPQFRSWSGNGRIGAQLQGGIDLTELATNTQLQIHDRVDHRIGRRAGTRKLLRVRVGSNERAPIWAEWPMIMHRPLPDDARIKGVTVHKRRRDCRRWEWLVDILIDTNLTATTKRSSTGACALNLGWAQRSQGLRAGYVVGDDGHEVEIVLSQGVIDRVEKAESIHSTRDKLLNTLRPLLIEAIGVIAGPPQWLVERCQHIHTWRSASRFASLARMWRQQRFTDDNEAYELVESWRYRDEHLQRYEAGLVRGAHLNRLDEYRKLAATLAAKYHTLIIDDTDLRDMQRSPRPEDERHKVDVVKRNQRHVSPHEVRAALVNAFSRIIKLSSINVTRTCYKCGAIEQWDRACSDRNHKCSSCSSTWDQDANACRNLLREWLRTEPEREAARSAKGTENKETRSDRLRRGRKKAA